MNRPFNLNRNAWILLLVCAFVMLPFLRLAEFNTKGEPRQTVVAYSILESGDWILPTNNGGALPIIYGMSADSGECHGRRYC